MQRVKTKTPPTTSTPMKKASCRTRCQRRSAILSAICLQLCAARSISRVNPLDRTPHSCLQIAIERTTFVVERLQDRRSFQAKIRHRGGAHLVDLRHGLGALCADDFVERVAFSLNQLRDRLTSRGQPVHGLAGESQVMQGLSKQPSDPACAARSNSSACHRACFGRKSA